MNSHKGFTIIENIYTSNETEQIIDFVNQAGSLDHTFRKPTHLFAIRQFLKEYFYYS